MIPAIDGKMHRRVLKLAVPSIFANITVPLVGMADLAIAGRMGDAASIGAVAIASMLFDLLYWNMGFLRTGTGGLTAQSYGRKDGYGAMKIFFQGIFTAVSIAVLILLLQTPYVSIALSAIGCTPEVADLASEYFYIRIWAAPATLSLYVFKGWFIGMQNSIYPMITDLTVNLVNIGASIYFALYTDMGFGGIALGTLIAQYTGLATAILLMNSGYRHLYHHIRLRKFLKLQEMKRFFSVNTDLFLRSACILAIYSGFTAISAKYGDTELAAGSIMMKMMLLFSYLIDGFAYAAEALTGRYIGAKDKLSLKKSSEAVFIWCWAIGLLSTAAYAAGTGTILRLMTSGQDVIATAENYTLWLLAIPIISCLAFTWDGIYIGASASVQIRNCMLFSVAGFFATYYALSPFIYGMHALWAGFTVHLAIRTVYLSAKSGKAIYSIIPQGKE